MTMPSSIPTQSHQYQEEPYFHHGTPERPADGGPLQLVTRYLCGAAYLDNAFAGRVIGELIEDEQRAVAPSYGFDLDPVVRHCFRARRLWLAQHAILTALLVGGLILVRGATVAVLFLAVPVMIGLSFRRKLGPASLKFLAAVGTALYAVLWLVMLLAADRVSSMVSAGSTTFDPTTGAPVPAPGTGGGLIVETLVLLGAVFGTVLWGAYTRLRILTTDLSPGAPHTAPAAPAGRVAQRLATVARAQHGNITLHAGRHPFLGAGETVAARSIVVELRPDKDSARGPVPRDFDPVDPVALNRYVKQRVAALRANTLPERQRVTGLTVRDYVITTGVQWRGYPLIDRDGVPYSHASQRAVEAIIRHPQASARHFLRVTVGTEGKQVVSDDNRVLLAPEDQEVQASAFVHIAVEGGLLYVEFVSTVLGALQPSFRLMDHLPTEANNLLGLAVRAAVGYTGSNALAAPLLLLRDLIQAAAVTRRMNRADRIRRETPAYNYGARQSVREIAAQREPDTYTRSLDAEKYSRIVIHRINDAVLDFLTECGVETAEYRAQATMIQNINTQIGGTYHGPVGMGHQVSMAWTAATAQKGA